VVGKALIEEELTVLRDAILYVHDETVKGMNEGKDIHNLMAEIELPPQLEVGQGYGKVSWSVRAIWEHYAGWFKHESTTELYATPQNAIHADLVELAGGPAAIVERAQQKIAEEKYVEAIHLLDIVLPQNRELPVAVSAALAAHEKLLRDSTNFWLSSWLKNQIKRLKSNADRAA
jgi:alkyl sulfatase BDS1-like metallo-beta-lactamase superfamily hydrolase